MPFIATRTIPKKNKGTGIATRKLIYFKTLFMTTGTDAQKAKIVRETKQNKK